MLSAYSSVHSSWYIMFQKFYVCGSSLDPRYEEWCFVLETCLTSLWTIQLIQEQRSARRTPKNKNNLPPNPPTKTNKKETKKPPPAPTLLLFLYFLNYQNNTQLEPVVLLWLLEALLAGCGGFLSSPTHAELRWAPEPTWPVADH